MLVGYNYWSGVSKHIGVRRLDTQLFTDVKRRGQRLSLCLQSARRSSSRHRGESLRIAFRVPSVRSWPSLGFLDLSSVPT